MSTQTEINEALVQYLQSVGYREDTIINELEKLCFSFARDALDCPWKNPDKEKQ